MIVFKKLEWVVYVFFIFVGVLVIRILIVFVFNIILLVCLIRLFNLLLLFVFKVISK